MTGVNEYGFPLPTSYDDKTLSQEQSIGIRPGIALPQPAEEKLRYLIALRHLATGNVRAAMDNARVSLSHFHEKVLDAYGRTWDALDNPDAKLSVELADIERDMGAAKKAEALYVKDLPLSRGALNALGGLAVEAVRFVNRNRNLKLTAPVKLEKSDTADALIKALDAAHESRKPLQRRKRTLKSSEYRQQRWPG